MVIGILLSGVLTAVIGTILALFAGFPIWMAVLIYPVIGAIGSIGFAALALWLSNTDAPGGMAELATSTR